MKEGGIRRGREEHVPSLVVSIIRKALERSFADLRITLRRMVQWVEGRKEGEAQGGREEHVQSLVFLIIRKALERPLADLRITLRRMIQGW